MGWASANSSSGLVTRAIQQTYLGPQGSMVSMTMARTASCPTLFSIKSQNPVLGQKTHLNLLPSSPHSWTPSTQV